MRQKLAQLAHLEEGAIWFPIIGLFIVASILLVIVNGPGNFFELGQIGQRKAEQVTEAARNTDVNRFSVALDPNADYDADGFKNGAETYMGTEPFGSCPTDTSRNAWPPDFNNDRTVSVGDIGLITQNFGSLNKRYDLNQDGAVTVGDIGIEQSYYGKFCSVFDESDPNEPQTPPKPGASELLDPYLAQIANQVLDGQSSSIIATSHELPKKFAQTFGDYLLQDQSQETRQIAGEIFCLTSVSDMKLYAQLDFLWAASFFCLNGQQIDRTTIDVELQYYDWGDNRWKYERYLGQSVFNDDNGGLFWGALRVEPYNGINCRRIRVIFRFAEGDDVVNDFRYSSGECY